MKKILLRVLLPPMVASAFGGFAVSAAAATPPSEDGLRAFAKLYGYLRFFHPSDEAAAIDWDAFAVYGAAEVIAAGREGAHRDLLETLQSLIEPIAPTACLYAASAAPCEPSFPDLDGSESYERVAWQHRGVGLGNAGTYRSIRTHRPVEVALDSSQGFGTATQALDATPYRGQHVRLRASIRANVDGPGNRGQMWLRVDREGGRGFFDNMADRPITSEDWDEYEIVGTIATDATRVVFGAFLHGIGAIWLDDVEVTVRPSDGQPWQALPVVNPGFEDHPKEIPGWGTKSAGYAFGIDDQAPGSGARSLHIAARTGTLESAGFEDSAALGELFEFDLGAGVRLRMPLTLPSRDGRTLPSANEALRTRLRNELEAMDRTTPSLPLRVAAVTIAWNVFQHFYPYFDVVEGDWDRALTDALPGRPRSHRCPRLSGSPRKTRRRARGRPLFGTGPRAFQPCPFAPHPRLGRGPSGGNRLGDRRDWYR